MGVPAGPESGIHEQGCAGYVNQAEQTARISGMVRSIIREELCTALRQAPVQPVRTETVNEDRADDTIMDFLNSF